MLKGKIQVNADFGVSKPKARSVDANQLTQLENEFHDGLEQGTKGFLKAAQAIRKILDSRLYLSSYETFEEYCNQCLGRSRSAIYKQLKQLAINEVINTQNTSNVESIPHAYPDPEEVTNENQKIEVLGESVFPASRLLRREEQMSKKIENDGGQALTEVFLFDEVTCRIKQNWECPGFREALVEWLDKYSRTTKL